jgi:hypothetical protein
MTSTGGHHTRYPQLSDKGVNMTEIETHQPTHHRDYIRSSFTGGLNALHHVASLVRPDNVAPFLLCALTAEPHEAREQAFPGMQAAATASRCVMARQIGIGVLIAELLAEAAPAGNARTVHDYLHIVGAAINSLESDADPASPVNSSVLVAMTLFERLRVGLIRYVEQSQREVLTDALVPAHEPVAVAVARAAEENTPPHHTRGTHAGTESGPIARRAPVPAA